MTNIVVIGSISMDLIMETTRIPKQGETVFGDSFSMLSGGKGANQAVAVGRLSSDKDSISMLGAVGQDAFGPILLKNLQENNLCVDLVGTVPGSSGMAQITLYQQDNRIIYCPGANGKVDTKSWSKAWDVIGAADLVILQNEIPHESNKHIAQWCHDRAIPVLYNPAPARKTDIELLDWVTYITPNQHEVQELFPEYSLEEALQRYPNQLIVTLGKQGSTYCDGDAIRQIPAIKTEALDTTGAGDTFNGALGYAISKGVSLDSALGFATLAAHLSVQKFGAQNGMPHLSDMKEHEAYEKAWDFE